jgi:Ca2+-binding EF-hand superfamily protein
LVKHIVGMGAALLVIGLIWGGSAPAESLQPRANKRALFKSLDKNKDRRLSRREFLTLWRNHKAGSRLFNRLDANRDGYLTYQEFSRPWGRSFQARHIHRGRLFRYLDTNQDGYLAPWELARFFADPSLAAAYFNRVDRDRDRRITWNEFRRSGEPGVMINILRW